MGGLPGDLSILNRLLFRDGQNGNAFLPDILPEECILRRFNFWCVGIILLSLPQVE